jgi:ABC-type Mn/Zn transport systems, ATPase component
VYSDKPILVLDEIDANVDAKTKQAIYKILEQEKERRIILMTTHIEDTVLAAITCKTIHIRQEKHGYSAAPQF